MNDLDLGPALRDRVRDAHPDLDRLAAVSLRAGTSLRRRRTAGFSLAAVAGVAAVSALAWQLSPSSPQSADVGFADGDPSLATVSPAPSLPPSPTPSLATAGPLVTPPCSLGGVTPTDPAVPQGQAQDLPLAPLTGLTGQVRPGDPRDGCLLPLGQGSAPAAPLVEQALPVHHRRLPGWTFGPPADDKFSATHGEYGFTVVVRPISELAAWSGGDPDHPHSQVVHQGGNYFVTLQGGSPVVPDQLRAELLAGLRFDQTWTR